jgi:5-oxoprolinase (ATP-hydrolysing)
MPARGRPDFWVASRAHHADVGGITPGSMPPFSRSIDEEGVLFDGERIVAGGCSRTRCARPLGGGPHPARNVERNLADLAAQLAANERGRASSRGSCAPTASRSSPRTCGTCRSMPSSEVRAALRALAIAGQRSRALRAPDGRRRTDRGLRQVDAATGDATVDFAGTSPQSASNRNAPLAVCTAAVLYVFRTLVDADIPLNEGCLAPIHLHRARRLAAEPVRPAAVVAGNVETSQVIVDALYGALGVLAGSQGTMNNFTFGDAGVQYYETIAGGAGAGDGFAGASGVQTHMTNSRLTDPEVLESRLPVLLREFAYRRGSGGDGRWRGGDGLVRCVEFRRPLTAAILSNHRTFAPRGLAGGGDGAPGRNRVVRADGRVEALAGTAEVAVHAGDRFVIETPGGGGYGAAAAVTRDDGGRCGSGTGRRPRCRNSTGVTRARERARAVQPRRRVSGGRPRRSASARRVRDPAAGARRRPAADSA